MGMWHFWLVGMGGALGAMARFGIGRLVGAWPGGWPMATFVVNLSGGVLMGLVATLLLPQGQEGWRLFLGVGVLGGFTTFSSFSLELLSLLDDGQWTLALFYALASVILSVVAVVAGMMIGRFFL